MASDAPKRKLVIPSGYAQCALQLQALYDTDPWYITFGIQSPIVTDVAMNVFSECVTQFVSLLDSSVSLVGVRVRDEERVDEWTASTPGTMSGSTLPSNCALLVKKQTASIGRKHRGRMYWPAMVQVADCTEAGVVASARVTAVQAKMTAFKAGMATRGFDLYILHSELLTEPGTAPAPTAITNLTVSGLIATQRRRLR
jgi:hypothetical protein